jgi:hypothetical protein
MSFIDPDRVQKYLALSPKEQSARGVGRTTAMLAIMRNCVANLERGEILFVAHNTYVAEALVRSFVFLLSEWCISPTKITRESVHVGNVVCKFRGASAIEQGGGYVLKGSRINVALVDPIEFRPYPILPAMTADGVIHGI